MSKSIMTAPKLIQNLADFRAWRQSIKNSSKGSNKGSLALVPTMGALHEGHLSLIRKAREISDYVVVYIFVNPLQFAPTEDFAKYPRTLEKDLKLCASMDTDVVFNPTEAEIYPEGRESVTRVVPLASLGDILEGAFRPGFFTGVSTVLTKFFSIVQPEHAVFGDKDYQQMLVVKKLVKDLNLPLTIHNMPTVRESDGLAVSSRNIYLSSEERAIAPKIQQILRAMGEQIKLEPKAIAQAVQAGKEMFARTKAFDLQYLEARDGETLEPANEYHKKIVLLTAAKLGTTRLIDNLILDPGS